MGHDHNNDFGFDYQGIYLFYGRKSGSIVIRCCVIYIFTWIVRRIILIKWITLSPLLCVNMLRVWLHCVSTIGYGGYGPPLGWQRGSRIVVAQAGYDGVNQTWVRQEDGSRMDDSECIKIAPQAACSD